MERRRFRRYRLRDGTLAVCGDNVGNITDIGLGGLSLEYATGESGGFPTGELDILVGASASRLKGIAIIPVSEIVIDADGQDPTDSLRRCGLRFSGLTDGQRHLLQSFIEANAVAEA